MNNVWIVIPALNESKYIKSVIENVKLHCKNIIIVDDGSVDNTSEICKSLGVNVIRHNSNKGKGVALMTGCEYALSQGANKIVVMDSDGQHDPKEIINIVDKLNHFNIVFTYRKRSKKMPIRFKFGNWFLSNVCKILFKVKLIDTQCGYRGFRSNVYGKLKWSSTGYVVESEMIKNVGKNNLSYCEVPIETIYFDNNKGTTVFDGIRIFCGMIKLRFNL